MSEVILNITYPAYGTTHKIKVKDERELSWLTETRLAQIVPGDNLGPEWKGYLLKITGGSDRDGFPIMQGVLTTSRVRLLLPDGSKCLRSFGRFQKRRKSVRGCILDQHLSQINLAVIRAGPTPIPGLSDKPKPSPGNLKRASKIRKRYNLSKDQDPSTCLVPQIVVAQSGRVRRKVPKIQRLLTPVKVRRRRKVIEGRRQRRLATKAARQAYKAKLTAYLKERDALRHASSAPKTKPEGEAEVASAA